LGALLVDVVLQQQWWALVGRGKPAKDHDFMTTDNTYKSKLTNSTCISTPVPPHLKRDKNINLKDRERLKCPSAEMQN
jgi:hypothetical protein